MYSNYLHHNIAHVEEAVSAMWPYNVRSTVHVISVLNDSEKEESSHQLFCLRSQFKQENYFHRTE